MFGDNGSKIPFISDEEYRQLVRECTARSGEDYRTRIKTWKERGYRKLGDSAHCDYEHDDLTGIERATITTCMVDSDGNKVAVNLQFVDAPDYDAVRVWTRRWYFQPDEELNECFGIANLYGEYVPVEGFGGNEAEYSVLTEGIMSGSVV